MKSVQKKKTKRGVRLSEQFSTSQWPHSDGEQLPFFSLGRKKQCLGKRARLAQLQPAKKMEDERERKSSRFFLKKGGDQKRDSEAGKGE